YCSRELLPSIDSVPGRIPNASSNEERVSRVLLERLFSLDLQGAACRIPDDLFDTGDEASTRRQQCLVVFTFAVQRRRRAGRDAADESVAEADEEYRRAVDRVRIDRAVERDRQPRARAEP